MNSFYGGKQGRTYHIVERYDCVNIISFINEYKLSHDETRIKQIAEIPAFDQTASYSVGEVFKDDKKDSSLKFYLVIQDFSNQSDFQQYTTEIKAMVQEFQKGGSYTKVNYGQYVIIDTIKNRNHKSDLENGLLFRRGFDYNQIDIVEKPNINSIIEDEQGNPILDENNNIQYIYYQREGDTLTFDKDKWQAAWSSWVENVGGGAIYVGQIVGPQGDTPQLFPIKWEDIQNLKDRGAEVRQQVPVSDTYGLIYDEEKGWVYDDTIKIGTATLKDEDGNITGADIAFDIPNPTVKVSAQVVNAYGNEALQENERTRTHQDEASGIIDEEINIQVNKDQNGKIISYSNLLHSHSATGKDAQNWTGDVKTWQYEDGWDETMEGMEDHRTPETYWTPQDQDYENHRHKEKTPHPFYLNYDIAIPRGIHGNDIASVQEEDAENILSDLNGYKIDVKEYAVKSQSWDEKENQYTWDIKNYQYDIKDYEYEQGWSEEMEGSEEHRTPIYYTEEDQNYEEHRTPIYWSEEDEGYEEHRHPVYWSRNDEGWQEHIHITYWQPEDEGFNPEQHIVSYYTEDDPDFEQHKHLIIDEEKDKDSEGNILVPTDKYITFSIKNYDMHEDGDIINAHAGRFPYRVINSIIENIRTRNFYVSGNAKIGDLYQYNNSDIFAICVKAGTMPENIQEFFGVEIPSQTEEIKGSADDAIWQILRLPLTAPPQSLTVDYKAGEDQTIHSHFLDYFYMDREGNVHVVYADGQDSYLGKINSILDVSYNQGTFSFSFSNGITRTFSVNTILDIKRVGDNLAVLYSDQEAIKRQRQQGVPCYDLPFEGEMKVYKVLANSMGNYHIQGKFDLIDLVKYTDPVDGQSKEGILFNGFENYEEGNQERSGWTVFTETNIDGEDIITIYAYDYNYNNYLKDDQDNYIPPYTIDQVPYTWTEQVEGQIVQHQQFLTNCPTYWFPIETVSITSIDPSYLYIIDKEMEGVNPPVPADNGRADRINNNALWFVVTTGHDNYQLEE